MEIWRDLTAFVLLAHLVTLSGGSIEGKGAFEEILARNLSIIVIEDKLDGPVNLEKFRNATPLASGYNNNTVVSNTTEVVDENELVVELEEALASAASSGQIVLIAPPDNNKGNSTESLAGPVIETPDDKSRSLVKEAVIKKNKKRRTTSSSLDQEIAQTRQRAGSENYGDDKDLETLNDLLAITEYEPQRIDGKTIDENIPQVASGQINSTMQSTSRSRPEDAHYDVPKQRNPPRNYGRRSNGVRPTPLKNSTNEASTAVAPNLRSIQTAQSTSTSKPPEYKVGKRKPTAPTKFHQEHKLIYTEISRGPRNSEIIVPLTTKSTASQKLTYNEVAVRNSPLGVPSSIDFVPGMSGVAEAHLRNIRNLTNISNQPRRNLHSLSARVETTPASLPTTYYPLLQQQASSVSAKTSSQPTLPTSKVPRASRRSDNYSNSDYVTSTNGELEPLTNQQLGYSTRYNEPSVVTRKVPKARPYPIPSVDRQSEASKESLEEKRSDEEDSSEEKSPKSSRTVIPVHDSYENDWERSKPPATTGRHPFIDYQKLYQNNNQRQQPIVDHENARRASKVNTIPSYKSYEKDENESPAAQNSAKIRSLDVTTDFKIYPRNKNSLVASTTTPVYDSYEDEKLEEPNVPLQQRFGPTGQPRQRTTINPHVVPSGPTFQPHNYFETNLQPGTPTSLVDNPNYQLQGIKTDPGPIAANAIYNPLKNYQQRRPSTGSTALEKESSGYMPHGTFTSRRIDSTSPPVARNRKLPNHLEHLDAKALHNVYSNNHNKATVTPLTPTIKQRTDDDYNEPISSQYTIYQTKPVNQLPPFAFNPERDANLANARVTTPGYVEFSDNEDESNDDGSYVTAATKLHRPGNSKRKNPVIRSSDAPGSLSYENVDQEESDSPLGSAKLIESNAANYGSKVTPRVVTEDEKNFFPSYTHAALTVLGRGSNAKTNYGGRRRASAYLEEEPGEAEQPADVEEAPYEDEVPASSRHTEDQATQQTHAKTEEHEGGGGGGGDHKHEEGGGVKQEEDHHESHGEKGDKGYKGYHEYDKGKKGHHDKESHDKEYDEKKGEKKKHADEGSYHKEDHHGEKDDNEAEFAEKGEHQKGHSTKGQHVVHKKDEYEKKTEFYDESHEEDGDEKEGEHHHEHEHKKGGHEKKGHHDSSHHQDKYGEKGEHEKGHHYREKKGHDGKDGKDQHHHLHEKYGKKGGHVEGLKWSHRKGDDGHEGDKKEGP